MNILGALIDTALTVSSVMTIVDNHTEPKTKKEREQKKARRRAVSDMRNAGYLLRRILK